MNFKIEIQVISLLPIAMALASEQVTSRTVSEVTGNCFVAFIVFIHVSGNPIQPEEYYCK